MSRHNTRILSCTNQTLVGTLGVSAFDLPVALSATSSTIQTVALGSFSSTSLEGKYNSPRRVTELIENVSKALLLLVDKIQLHVIDFYMPFMC